MKRREMIEQIARRLHNYTGGLSMDEYEKFVGFRRTEFEEIEEWERDELRGEAKAVLNLIEELGMAPPFVDVGTKICIGRDGRTGLPAAYEILKEPRRTWEEE